MVMRGKNLTHEAKWGSPLYMQGKKNFKLSQKLAKDTSDKHKEKFQTKTRVFADYALKSENKEACRQAIFIYCHINIFIFLLYYRNYC